MQLKKMHRYFMTISILEKNKDEVEYILFLFFIIYCQIRSHSLLFCVIFVLLWCTSMSYGATSRSIFSVTSEQHHWFSGKISACQAGASGSIGDRIRPVRYGYHDSPG